MKIAIMVCGEFRWFDNFKTTFETNFKPALSGHNIQYFAHFWDQDLERLSEFTNICQPIITDIETKLSYSDVKAFFGNKKDLTGSATNQAYGAYKSFLLLEKYQKQHNMKFDLYIKMRSDLVFLNEIKLDKFDLQSIYVKDIVHWRPVSNYINDYIYFTRNYKAVEDLAKIGFGLDVILEKPELFIYQKDVEKNIFCPEEVLARHAVIKKISVKTYSFNIDLARHHI